jgi:MoxR-like ATPase
MFALVQPAEGRLMSESSAAPQRLSRIARHYLADQDYLQTHREQEARRLATLAGIQQIIADFIASRSAIRPFRDQLDAYLRQPEGDDWGARTLWMMNLNKLASNHDQRAETTLRTMLDGLNATNVAERFEAFARFLEEEKRRLNQSASKLVAPGHAPFFISLLADWLDPDGRVVVAWPTVREGLRVLLDAHALPDTVMLARIRDGVRIATAQDYANVQHALQWCATIEPEIARVFRWWDKRFLDWVRLHKAEVGEWLDIHEHGPVLMSNAPLEPLEPEQLRERIRAIRRELLVPDHLVRRVYHALVLGQHVILSGPPGTGKTALASLLPRELWHAREEQPPEAASSYTVRVVTATDEWTPRHVIGGIMPVTSNGQVSYEIVYGCLARTIMDNWNLDEYQPQSWTAARRCGVFADNGQASELYRGRWLVIDEFNRAPIDLALGEALTAIGSSAVALNVPTAQGVSPLPIPADFRIIGTLNTFDRHFLNRISEALKRRFTFIEMLPPPRQEREAEQAIVLRKVLAHLQPVSRDSIRADGLRWPGLVALSEGEDIPWQRQWEDDTAARHCFEEGWRLFEAIRLYRQFGTAQALGWATAYLGAGLLDGLALDDATGWRNCLDAAFADTLADQLQILFPDEIEALLALLRTSGAGDFVQEYHAMLTRLTSLRRRSAQVMALQSVRDAQGQPALSLAAVRDIVNGDTQQVPASVLVPLFHADQPRQHLPALEERLERFLFERMI